MKKDEIVTAKIVDMSERGEGIGKIEGYTLFLKDTVIGDEVLAKVIKAKKTYGYGKLLQVLKPSSKRVKPLCPVARQCGGCQLQEMHYEEQLRYKEQKVKEHLVRIGRVSSEKVQGVFEPILGMGKEVLRYRNKALFPVGADREGNPVAGFYAGRTHYLVPCQDCLLGKRENREILRRVLEYMKDAGISAYHEITGEGSVRHVLIRSGFVTGEILICLVVNEPLKESFRLVERLREIPGVVGICISENKKKTNVVLGEDYRVLWGKGTVTDWIGSLQYEISPLSFYQVNPVQTESLYELVLHYTGLSEKPGQVVWDLYCGIGTISLYLAKRAKWVYGVEIVSQAVKDAKENAKKNGIENVTFFQGKAEEIAVRLLTAREEKKQYRADVVVVDPPRKGCDATLLETILLMAPERIVYVSCDSATLARDVKILCEGGYELERGRAVDMFPMTVHVETVVLMSRAGA